MAYIGNIPAESYASFETETFSVSATANYTLSHAVTNENEIRLVINGVVQQPGSGKAYTASNTTLTLTSATVSGDVMYAVYLGRALQTVNPPNASVGLSQLSATGTKSSSTFLRGDNTFAAAGSPSITDNGNANAITIDSNERVQFTRPRSNTLGDSALEILPSDTVVGVGFRMENTNNDLVVEKSSPSGSEAEILRIRSGGGIALGGTGDANTLDDYEEGTWTPVFSGGVSGSGYDRQDGRYTKIGNKVLFEFDIQGNGLGATTAQVTIGGFPFTSINAAPYGGGVMNYGTGIYTSEQLLFHIGGNDTTMYLYQLTGSNFLGTEAVDINDRMIVHGQYTVA